MPSPAPSGREFAAFDPPLARAVVTVLVEEGVPAWMALDAEGTGRVYVAPSDHDTALACLDRRLPDVQALAARERLTPHDDLDQPAERSPLVMERFRRIGVLVGIVLAPLLVLTLATFQWSRTAALLLLAGGVAAVILARLGDPRS